MMHFSKKSGVLYNIATLVQKWMGNKYVRVVISGCCALFLAISLVTYRSTDSSWLYCSTQGVVNNWCSVFGAHCAALFIYLFGMSAWVMVVWCAYMAYYAWCYSGQKKQPYCILITLILLAPLGSALSFWYHLEWYHDTYPGGVVGTTIVTYIIYWFDTLGAFLFLHVTAVCMLMIMFPEVIWYGVRGFTKFVQITCNRKTVYSVYRLIAAIINTMGVALMHVLRFVWRALHGSSSVLGSTSSVIVFERLDAQQDMPDQDPFWHALLYPAVLVDQQAQSIQQMNTKNETPRTEARNPSTAEVKESERKQVVTDYVLPNITLFASHKKVRDKGSVRSELQERSTVLEQKLERFGVFGRVTAIKEGPVVTLFEYQPDMDTKISKILALEDDLAMALQALSIRIIAPIPGRSVVGFEVANNQRSEVLFADIIRSKIFQEFKGTVPLVLGEDTVGNQVVVDLTKMPHLLIAGSTGSGKSVALNAMLISMLCKLSPQQLRLILIDPKRLEFAPYADIQHLLFPIITDPKKVAPVLAWVVRTMEMRYELMAQSAVRNITDYNKEAPQEGKDLLPTIVVVIDELADLMMTAAREVEDLIARIAQMARAAGIHLMVATQRPSVDVITGLIKVNFTSRISFRVTCKVDSRTILDAGGADKLLGRGDMLFLDSSSAGLKRVHGAYVSDKEIESVITHIRSQGPPCYLDLAQELTVCEGALDDEDELYHEVCTYVQSIDEVSISLLQRRFRIGFNRSARMIDMLETQGIIMPSEHGKTRKVVR